jgi:hypothetical protein
MKKISTVMFLALLILGQTIFANNLPVKNQDVSPDQLKSQNKEITSLVAEQLSKDLPKTIDKYTEFTSVVASDANLIYTFEINTGSKSDKTVINEDRTRMKEAVTSGICRSSKRFMDAQITITYKYISAKSKVKLFQFDVSQVDCYKLYGIK